MQSNFDLIITADYPSRTAELSLLDGHGSQLVYRKTDFNNIAVSRQQGLFDLRNYLRHYVEPGKEAASVAEIGVCIAEQLLGEEIFRHLWASESQRTLRIELPGATEEENHLAAALDRVPWEIAYLNDALAASLDQLIHDASPDARRLLWMIAVANDPVSLGLLNGAWSGESHEQQQLRQIKQMLDILDDLRRELQEKLRPCRRNSGPHLPRVGSRAHPRLDER